MRGIANVPVFRGRYYNSGSEHARCRIPGLRGLGQGPTNEELETYLDHSRVPRHPGGAKRIPNIQTAAEVKHYAANGFHVSVDEGLKAQKRNVRLLWARAAYAYHAVYFSSADVEKRKQGLHSADAIADTARINAEVVAQSEGKPTPAMPAKPTSAAAGEAGSGFSRRPLFMVAVAAAALGTGYLLFSKRRRTA